MPSSDSDESGSLLDSFPKHMASVVESVLSKLPPAQYSPSGRLEAVINGEKIEIPSRVYYPKMRIPKGEHGIVAHCIYSRHHDGFVRERHIAKLLSMKQDWVVPFVLLPLGEYVMEIIRLVQENRSVLSGESFRKFSLENPDFIRRTKSRVVSYWDCYYRGLFPSISSYPGFLVLEDLGWWDSGDIPKLRAC